jgi:hypothetical protein
MGSRLRSASASCCAGTVGGAAAADSACPGAVVGILRLRLRGDVVRVGAVEDTRGAGALCAVPCGLVWGNRIMGRAGFAGVTIGFSYCAGKGSGFCPTCATTVESRPEDPLAACRRA